ncbi:GNAT family N-acetyltransferase [Streptomyces qinglanensis]|uniref:GNAT family N-acetyltransferase n=1 Tax=Streptomyces qinglanensis TaxID=943816 RepID=UPI003D73DD14
MTTIRRATAADADALTRARAELLRAAPDTSPDAAWLGRLREHLRTGLAAGTHMAAFVIDTPGGGTGGELASCALGTVHQHLPGPRHNGLSGHIHLVATTEAHRRRGYATAVLTALVDWLHERGCKVINLNATSDGDRLYRNLGFAPNTWAMRLARR